MRPMISIVSLLAGVSAAFAQDAAAPATPPPPPPQPDSFWEGWTGGFELGLNGASGNSENFNFRAGVGAERKTDLMVTKFGATYTRATREGDVTSNRFEANGRNDWIFEKGSPWRAFAQATYEYDDFQDWDHRLSAGVGIGYAFVDTDTTLLVGRVGVGAFREFGGRDNRIHPEGILGVDFSHKFDDRQKVFFIADYYPDLIEWPDYRLVAKAGYEYLVDPKNKMTLKLGVEDRYDASPGPGRSRNDFEYFALLAWSF